MAGRVLSEGAAAATSGAPFRLRLHDNRLHDHTIRRPLHAIALEPLRPRAHDDGRVQAIGAAGGSEVVGEEDEAPRLAHLGSSRNCLFRQRAVGRNKKINKPCFSKPTAGQHSVGVVSAQMAPGRCLHMLRRLYRYMNRRRPWYEMRYIRVYGEVPGDQVGLYLRYHGVLLGLWDPQNRDLRRKLPPETKF